MSFPLDSLLERTIDNKYGPSFKRKKDLLDYTKSKASSLDEALSIILREDSMTTGDVASTNGRLVNSTLMYCKPCEYFGVETVCPICGKMMEEFV